MFFRDDDVERCEDGSACPICLEEMEGGRLLRCRTCRNWIHEECFTRWKRSGGRRTASCVVCRAKWRTNGSGQENYLNLGAFIHQEDVVAQDDGAGDRAESCGR